VVDLADLEVNVLEFRHKSFGFARVGTVAGTEYAVFHRTETESETKFRPKILRLVVVVPRAWIVYDLAAEVLLLARDGVHAGTRPTGSALEASVEADRFLEQSIEFERHPTSNGVLYVPTEIAPTILSPEGRSGMALRELLDRR
jgi:hypothetical protein